MNRVGFRVQARRGDWRGCLLALALTLGLPVAAKAKHPPALAPKQEQADAIRVYKSDRRMELLRGGQVIRRYRVALGKAPVGHKRQQGDQRTPEGDYRISHRNAGSRFHLSLRVSYPNQADQEQASAHGLNPGGDIMVHGATPPGDPRDWTEGCIAVTNAEIEEVWRLVPVGTPISIRP